MEHSSKYLLLRYAEERNYLYIVQYKVKKRTSLMFFSFKGGVSEDAGCFPARVFQILPPSFPQGDTNPEHTHRLGRLLGESKKGEFINVLKHLASMRVFVSIAPGCTAVSFELGRTAALFLTCLPHKQVHLCLIKCTQAHTQQQQFSVLPSALPR